MIAEGVNTPAQAIRLLQMGCEIAQGFGIAEPMPAAQLCDWIARGKADPQVRRLWAGDSPES